jgi:uncharacterized membrane protein YgcG
MDQESYNKAFKNAINKYKEDQKNKDKCEQDDVGCQVGVAVMFVIMIIFYLWALILALKVSDSEHRTLHVLFALATGPLYVLSHYASMLGGESSEEYDSNSSGSSGSNGSSLGSESYWD